MYSRVKKYLKILVKWQIKQRFFKARKGLCRWLDTIWGFVADHAVRCCSCCTVDAAVTQRDAVQIDQIK